MRQRWRWYLTAGAALASSAVIVLGSVVALARSRPAIAAEAQAPSASVPVPDYAFPSGAGILFFHIKPDKIADFETVVGRLAAALDATQDPVRKQQASS